MNTANRHTDDRQGLWWVMGAVGLIAGAAAYAAWTRLRHQGHAHRAAPAFRDAEPQGPTDPHCHQQVRHAGPEHMRDEVRRPWEVVDEASDASFPASDPPSYSAGAN